MMMHPLHHHEKNRQVRENGKDNWVLCFSDEAAKGCNHFGGEHKQNLLISVQEEHSNKDEFEDVDKIGSIKKPCDNDKVSHRLESTQNGISDCQWPKEAGERAGRRELLKERSEMRELCVDKHEREDWITPGKVLSMSLVKLRKDPNLLRSVVINNTVRTLEERIKRDILTAFNDF